MLMIKEPGIDIFNLPQNTHEAMCVTTNGIVKANGCAVMGAGIAKTVNQRFHVDKTLADLLLIQGNIPFDLGIHSWNGHMFHLLSFPTKHHWSNPSDIDLIKQSAMWLVIIANQLNLSHIYLTPPGCGCGQLDWADVKAVIEPILDDRFIVVFNH